MVFAPCLCPMRGRECRYVHWVCIQMTDRDGRLSVQVTDDDGRAISRFVIRARPGHRDRAGRGLGSGGMAFFGNC